MAKYTVNENGYINDIDNVVEELTKTYEAYVREIFTNKTVNDLSMNEMSYIRLVSSSSILSMKKDSMSKDGKVVKGKSNLEILNTPAAKPSVAKSQPLTEDVVAAFLAKLSPEKRKQLVGC